MKLVYILGAILIGINMLGLLVVQIYERVRKETIKTKIMNSIFSALLFVFTSILTTIFILRKEYICIIFLVILLLAINIILLISSVLELLDKLRSKKNEK